MKLKNGSAVGGPIAQYDETLGVLTGHDVVRRHGGIAPPIAVTRGGLSSWQQKKVAEFIEQNLADDIRLTVMASIVGLSPYHFGRAFKQSFGVPPHRYHMQRRIERAKILLAEAAQSVTAVAMAVGFAETSSFSAAFRRVTGVSPRVFRRRL
jgi:AraC family transcriptional regulator